MFSIKTNVRTKNKLLDTIVRRMLYGGPPIRIVFRVGRRAHIVPGGEADGLRYTDTVLSAARQVQFPINSVPLVFRWTAICGLREILGGLLQWDGQFH
jgi:hypothetical protein